MPFKNNERMLWVSKLEPTRDLRLKYLIKLKSHLELRSQLELQKPKKRSQLEQNWIFNLKYLKLEQFWATENLHTYSYILKDLLGLFTLQLSGGIQKLWAIKVY